MQQQLESLAELLRKKKITMNDLVSIIMPSYNTGMYIKNSINSVLEQTYTNWELIIVDDCSSDNTLDIISSYNDERIRLFVNENNLGAALTRNRALREAKGKWIAFLDSDDIWESTKLQEQIKFMEDNNYSMTYTDYRICNNGVWEDVIRTSPKKVNLRKLYNYCYFFTSTVVYNANETGLIQIADIKKNNDYAMWFKALEKIDYAYRYPKCLSYYIKHNNSVSSGSKAKLIKHFYIMYKKCMNKNITTSVILTVNNVLHGVIKSFVYKRKINK